MARVRNKAVASDNFRKKLEAVEKDLRELHDQLTRKKSSTVTDGTRELIERFVTKWTCPDARFDNKRFLLPRSWRQRWESHRYAATAGEPSVATAGFSDCYSG